MDTNGGTLGERETHEQDAATGGAATTVTDKSNPTKHFKIKDLIN